MRNNKEKLRDDERWSEILWVCLTDELRLWGLLKLMDEQRMTVYHSPEEFGRWLVLTSPHAKREEHMIHTCIVGSVVTGEPDGAPVGCSVTGDEAVGLTDDDGPAEVVGESVTGEALG